MDVVDLINNHRSTQIIFSRKDAKTAKVFLGELGVFAYRDRR